MRIRTAVLTVGAAMLAACLLCGCGGSGGSDVPGDTERYLPLAVGNVWQYNYTEYAAPTGIKSFRPSRHHSRLFGTKELTSTDTVTVTGTTAMGGTDWATIVYHYTGEPDQVTYMRHNAAGLLGRTSATTQPFFVMKNPVEVGTTWLVTYDSGDTSRMTVQSIDDTIATPAGTYTNCMQVEEVFDLPGGETGTVTYWYAPNVGEVREEYHVGTELQYKLELTAFTPAPVGAAR